VHYGKKKIKKNQHWVFRYDYLKYINSKAITQIIQGSLNIHVKIIVDIIDINMCTKQLCTEPENIMCAPYKYIVCTIKIFVRQIDIMCAPYKYNVRTIYI